MNSDENPFNPSNMVERRTINSEFANTILEYSESALELEGEWQIQ